MADACVGGKSGVNFPPYGKNQVGLFYFPSAVRTWPGWLKTLPERELRAGGVECLKHAMLIGDARLGHRLAEALGRADASALAPLLPEVVKVKADVVAADPGENGQRAILNFGHTLGHALEGLSQERTQGVTTLLHGEAVAVGIAFALTLSRRVAALAPETADSLYHLLRNSGCLPSPSTLSDALGGVDLRAPELFTDLKRFVGNDKKAAGVGRTSAWVLLDAPGSVARESRSVWTISIFDGELDAAWTAFLRAYR
jgi:3-dehydroquinate synthase